MFPDVPCNLGCSTFKRLKKCFKVDKITSKLQVFKEIRNGR